MTLVEFLAPLNRGTNRDKCLAAMYYAQRYEDVETMTVEDVRKLLQRARVSRAAKINVADVLAKSGHYVDSPGSSGARRLWKLTDTGKGHIREQLGLPESDPEIEHDVAALQKVVQGVNSPEVRDYLEEALLCLKVGALRATVVFVWTGAVRTLHERALAKGVSKKDLNNNLQRHDSSARKVSSVNDFAYIKDAVFLKAVHDIGLVDKAERDILKQALDLRNKCGHPTKYKPGVQKVKSFMEDVAPIVF